MSTQLSPQESEFQLYEGEERKSIGGNPVVYKYIPADNDEDKPLVAFVPGMAHNARISYGGHAGSCSEDFLAHWFHHSGNGFLGISYPLEMESPMMPATSATFTLSEWGLQTALTIWTIIKQEKLSMEVIVLGWSMAGKIIQPLTIQLARLGIKVVLFVSLAATPALPGLLDPTPRKNLELTATGYAINSTLKPIFLSQLGEQDKDENLAPSNLIDPVIYEKEYIGATPIGITGSGFRYNSDTKDIVEEDDKWKLMKDAQVHDYQSLPTIGAIYPKSGLDFRHALSDKTTWSFLMNQQVMAQCYQNGIAAAYCHDSKINTAASLSARRRYFSNLREIVHGIPSSMTTQIPGNHFFFVGKIGAKRTAESVLGFLKRSKDTEKQLEWLAEMHRVIIEATQRK